MILIFKTEFKVSLLDPLLKAKKSILMQGSVKERVNEISREREKEREGRP